MKKRKILQNIENIIKNSTNSTKIMFKRRFFFKIAVQKGLFARFLRKLTKVSRETFLFGSKKQQGVFSQRIVSRETFSKKSSVRL